MNEKVDRPLLDRRGLAKNRIEALADGIFAVAMTLLVLDIKSPVNLRFETPGDLVDYLVGLEHSFAMYAISFLVLAIFWIGHHVLFHFVRHVDRRLLWLNITFLLLVTFVPFSTDLLGDHGHLMLPVIVYGLNLIALGALLDLQLRYLRLHPALASPDLTPVVSARMHSEVKVYALIPLASMLTSLWSPRLGMYLYFLLVIPTFAPGRLDRLLHPGGPEKTTEPSSDDP
jgi:uncharacterized membrane protein